MKSKSIKIRLPVFIIIVIGFIAAGRFLLARCPKPPEQLDIESIEYIKYLYPWPHAKIPFMCQTRTFLKSPLAPAHNGEDVFKEDGYRALNGRFRDGVIVVRIYYYGEIYRQFPEPIKSGRMHPFAAAVSIYVDGKKLEIGHAGYTDDIGFNFATIRTPFL